MSQVFGGAPPPRSSSPWAWCLWIVIVGGLLMVLAMVALVGFGWKLYSDEVQRVLQDEPAIQEHIGTISSMDLDFSATTDEDLSSDQFVWDLEGDRGKGRVLVELITEEDGGESLSAGTLTLPDGREFALGAAAGGDAPATDAAPAESDAAAPAGLPGDPDDGNLKGQVPDKGYESGAPNEPTVEKE
jgi:hypothetical protein